MVARDPEDYSDVLLKTRKASRSLEIYFGGAVLGMLAFSSALLSWLAGRFRGRVELEVEVIAFRRYCPPSHSQLPTVHTIRAERDAGGQR